MALGSCSFVTSDDAAHTNSDATDRPSTPPITASLAPPDDVDGLVERQRGDGPEASVVREFLAAVEAGDADAVYRRLSTPARVATGFRDGLDLAELGVQVPDDVDDAELRVLADVVPGIDVVVIDDDQTLIVRSEIGELLIEPVSPLSEDGAAAGASNAVLPVEGTEMFVAVDPVRGAAIVDGGPVGQDPAARQDLLAEGDRGSEVSEWQRQLADELTQRGLSPVAVDGVFGPGTAAGTARLEEALGLEADGVVDTELLAVLAEG